MYHGRSDRKAEEKCFAETDQLTETHGKTMQRCRQFDVSFSWVAQELVEFELP